MKSPITELKEYAAKVDEMEYLHDPGDVINKLLTLISKLPDESSTSEEKRVELVESAKRLRELTNKQMDKKAKELSEKYCDQLQYLSMQDFPNGKKEEVIKEFSEVLIKVLSK